MHLAAWPVAPTTNFDETVEELRLHFKGSVRLGLLRDLLEQEMKKRDIGIGDMFALVDEDKSLSVDPLELHEMARRLGCAARLADAERLVEEVGDDGELTIEAFVEWFHAAGRSPERKPRPPPPQTPADEPEAKIEKVRGGRPWATGRTVASRRRRRALDAYRWRSGSVYTHRGPRRGRG